MRPAALLLSAILIVGSAAACGSSDPTASACDAWISAENAFMAAPTPDKAAMMDKASAALNHAVDVSTGKTHDALVLYRDIRHDPGAAQDASVNAVFAAVVSCQNAGAKVSLSGG